MSFPKKQKPNDTITTIKVEDMLAMLNDDDKDTVSSVDPEARDQLVQEFYKMNLKTRDAIEDILNTQPKIDKVNTGNIKTKKEYYDGFIALYNELVAKFEQAFANRKENSGVFYADVNGDIEYGWKVPNLETWQQQNPIKTQAINCFLTKLRNNGWEPRLKHVDDYITRGLTEGWGYINGKIPSTYEGGKTVCIKCDLF